MICASLFVLTNGWGWRQDPVASSWGNASEAECSDGFVAEASLFICLTRERLSIHCLQDSHVGHSQSRCKWVPLPPNEKGSNLIRRKELQWVQNVYIFRYIPKMIKAIIENELPLIPQVLVIQHLLQKQMQYDKWWH